MNPSQRHTRRGFTLVEAALTTTIVSLGVVAILATQDAYQKKNNWAQRVSTALLLGNELRELTMNMPLNDPILGQATWGPEENESSIEYFDDVDDFDGVDGEGMEFSPPITALREEIPDMEQWTQRISVHNVNSDSIDGSAQDDNSTDMMRVTVEVFYQGPIDKERERVTRVQWITAGRP